MKKMSINQKVEFSREIRQWVYLGFSVASLVPLMSLMSDIYYPKPKKLIKKGKMKIKNSYNAAKSKISIRKRRKAQEYEVEDTVIYPEIFKRREY